MPDFFDWLSAADAGQATDRLAERFRLSQEEMRATTDALVPAFMLGLRRAMGDPEAWAGVTQAAQAFVPGTGALPSAADGRRLLDALFGSELSEAVARRVSALTGQTPDAIQTMMPALGALTIQSMLGMAGRHYPTDNAGQALAEALKRSAAAVEAFNRPSGSQPAAGTMPFFADAMRMGLPWMSWPGMAGGGGAPPADPFAMFAGLFQPPLPKGRPESPPPRAASPSPSSFWDMMSDAQAAQAEAVREMMALFQRFEKSSKT
ncbi:DUF937 domain-containing protein [Aureimonas sp. AU4]|uniref:DUF937 domain-containing protein n=1 Tax=Aureimonas sp. AU4 TaxID=1638163 RepID=UPI000780DD27|nr:DUF937 domain-containing protein [Aureimonas sp. AU4]